MTRTKDIDGEVLRALQAGSWRDGGFIMPQLERRLYLKAAEVLKALGGKWDRKSQSTLFEDEDVAAALQEAVETGKYCDPQRLYEFFETPASLAEAMAAALGAKVDSGGTATGSWQGKSALEPSAGAGALACELRRHGAEVWTIDVDPSREAPLRAAGFHHATNDFLEVAPSRDYDVIMMNPPFSRSQDVKHVRRAWEFLKPGGRLAAILAAGWTFRSDRLATEFRQWLEEIGADWEHLPENSFKAAGTSVRTTLVTAVRED